MKDFSQRLAWCMKRGDLTVSDLTRWFDRPRATVNTWVDGRTPYGPSGRLAIRWLELLQNVIKNKAGFPIPEELSGKARSNYIRDIRDAVKHHTRVPAMRASL